MRLFKNRQEAAGELAGKLAFLKDEKALVLAVPNYGVPLAATIAESLDAPLDILLIAKLSAPHAPDQTVGAVDEHGRISMIQSAARWHHLTAQEMIAPARKVFADLQSRRSRFRAVLPESEVRGRVVIVVDVGVDTGATMLAAIASLRDRGAAKVIVAAPAGRSKATWQLHEAADNVVIPHSPSRFKGVDHFYQEFDEVSDREVEAILQRWSSSRPHEHPGVKTLVMRVIGKQQQVLHCELDLPPAMSRGGGPYPAVIFTHGLESHGRSPRTVPISRRLAKRKVIGVRMDFTGHGRSEGTLEQATEEQMVSDLRTVVENVCFLQEVDPKRLGITGAGTGGMVALRFAAQEPQLAAMVIRGPLTGGEIEATRAVKAPTLLIHGEHDPELSRLAQSLDDELASIHKLLVIPESSRWFSDPISLELMVSASVDWLVDHLVSAGLPGEPPVIKTPGVFFPARGS